MEGNLEQAINQLKIESVVEEEHKSTKLSQLDQLVNLDITKITSLDLSNSGLSNLPISLNKLHLKELDLSRNGFEEVPQCLYDGLEQLVKLDLSHNYIKTFEFEPNCSKSLEILLLSSNKLKDIPKWILSLRAKNLKELYYDFNKVTLLRCIFDNSVNFSVRKLSMKNCILRDCDFKFLKECRYLEELDISNSEDIYKNNYSNVLQNIDLLFQQPFWKNIYILKLNNLSISVFPQSLTWLETLRELYLSNNYFMWLPNDGLEFLVNLEVLDVSHNVIWKIPDKLTWLEYVRVLNLSYNNIEIIPDFSKMKSLKVLDLYNNRLTSFYCNIDEMNLESLDLEYNQFDTAEFMSNTYIEMRNELRKTVSERFCGVQGVVEITDDEYSGSICDELDIVEDIDYFTSAITEDWDEEIMLNERHQEITQSDDEWEGIERSQSLSITRQPHVIDDQIYNEYVIFCDAD